LRKLRFIQQRNVDALRALWHLERSSGNTVLAEQYRLKLLALSPLDSVAAS
jgi:hypothetical protein